MQNCNWLIGHKTGFDSARGPGSFANQGTDNGTGIFVMIIGAYVDFSSLSRGLFERF